MCHQMPFWCGIKCKTFLVDYGCGCGWAVPDYLVRKTSSGEITEFCGNLGECCKKLGEFAFAHKYCPHRIYYWINSEKGGSSNFQDLFTGIHCFRTDSSNLSCKKGKAWKLLETIINSRQGLSRNKISNFSEIDSWKHFSGSAKILVPTVTDWRNSPSSLSASPEKLTDFGVWRRTPRNRIRPASKLSQEDVNGEQLTVKKWWIFGADFFTVWCGFFHGLVPIFHGL